MKKIYSILIAFAFLLAGTQAMYAQNIQNGSFETGDVTGWTLDTNFPAMPGDTPSGITQSFDVVSGVGEPDGTYCLRLNISGSTDPYGTAHGPSATSSIVTGVEIGDLISVDWRAEHVSDDYDVYAFIVEESSGEETQLFYQQGSTQPWTTTTLSSPYEGDIRFKFICGTYDRTGGQAVGSQLYIDNIKILRPLALPATAYAPTSFDANWETYDGSASYVIDVATDENFTSMVAGYDNFNVGNVTTSTISGLAGGVIYYYRIRAVDGGGTQSANSNVINTAPTIVATAATNRQPTTFDANWEETTEAVKYFLDVSTASDFSSFISGFNNLDVGNVLTYTVTGLSSNVTYYYRVRAMNALSTTTINSNTITTTTNSAPVITSNANVSANEGQTNATTVTATDIDAGDTQAYTITGGDDQALFTLNLSSGVLTFLSAPVYATPGDANGDNVYIVEVTVTDADGLTDVQTINVTVVELVAPIITSSATVSIPENQTAAITVTATDPGDTQAYSISGGDDQALFALDIATGELTFLVAPNFEIPTDANTNNDYLVEVTVTDNGGLTDTQLITVTVTNINEAVTITSTSAVNVNENQTAAITVTATDVDAGDTQAYTTTGGDDLALFTIDVATGELTFLVAPNYEVPTDANTDNDYIVEVTVTDAGGLTDVQTITITVDDIFENPTITSANAVSVEENQTAAITVVAIDEDAGDTQDFSITNGDDQLLFAIDAATGELTFLTAPNYEIPTDANADNDYIVEVTVADSEGLTYSQTITVTVTNVNEAVIITSVSAVNVDENQTDAITVTATDEDAGDTQVFTTTGGDDQAVFTIDATSGVLTFVTAPNYEVPTDANADNDYIVEVTVTDGGGLTDVQLITITVDNVNENPSITSFETVEVDENQIDVITVTATDEDAADTQAFTTTGGADQALFAIDATTGVLTFVAAPDYENPTDTDTDNDYIVEVTVTDNGSLTDVQIITVTVLNVAEFTDNAPVITSDDLIEVDENQVNVITVTATDDDADDTQAFSITGGDDQDLFVIDATTGVLTFVTAPNYENPTDANTDNDYIVEVTVTDNGGLTDMQFLTVTVLDVYEVVIKDEIEANNLITPNGDGKNDYWVVADVEALEEYELFIFNNLGVTIYQTVSYDNTWDATHNGSSVISGTYYYMFVNGNDVLKGVITIVNNK